MHGLIVCTLKKYIRLKSVHAQRIYTLKRRMPSEGVHGLMVCTFKKYIRSKGVHAQRVYTLKRLVRLKVCTVKLKSVYI